MNTDGAPSHLRRVEHSEVFLDPGSYAWVQITRFEVEPVMPTDHEAIDALIRSADYVDTSLVTYPAHGPYELRHITPGAFRHVGSEEAATQLRRWITEEHEVATSAQVREEVERQVVPSLLAGRVYVMDRLPPAAEHEMAATNIGLFLEYVVLDAEARALTLVTVLED